MSSATATRPAAQPRSGIPQPIANRLRGLRAAIRRFVLVDGLSRVVLTVVVLAIIDLGVDWLFRMDRAQRAIMLVVLAAIVLAVAWRRLIRPLLRRNSDDALVLQVEQRNRQLGESLISAVQFSRHREELLRQGCSDAMLGATIDQGTGLAGKTDFGATVNSAALTRNLILLLAGIAALATIGFGVVNNSMLKIWFNRNLLLTDDQWPRNTLLAVAGAVDGHLVLPRGEDHRQIVEVLAESRVQDVEVTIEFDDGISRTSQKMRRTGMLDGREHLLVFRNVVSPFRFRASGGDDVTDWIDVTLVEPPAWSELQLVAIPPEYTGVLREELPPGGGPHSLLAGSSLEITAVANKPLQRAGLKSPDQDWTLQGDESGSYTLVIPADELAGTKYTFDLADESGLRSSRPAAFTVRIKPDRPPTVRAALLGISGLVVPRARVPVSWNANDEYAMTGAEFQYDWTGDSAGSVPQAGSVDLAPPGSRSETAVQLGSGATEIRSVDVLDLEPLGVPTGVSFNFSVAVTDRNTLTGPGTGHSRRFLLRVVSEDELRSDLLRREMEQRQAFELILKNQEELQVDLRALAATASTPSAELDQQAIASDMLNWQRRQKLVGTNMAAIADRFEEFLVEVRNNRLDETQMELDPNQTIEVRFDQRIIQPIRALDQAQVTQAVQLLDQSQRAIGERTALVESLTQTTSRQDEIIAEMRNILAAMQDSETYQELVNLAIEVRERQKKIRDLAKEQQNNTGTEGIFDDVPNSPNNNPAPDSGKNDAGGKDSGGNENAP